MALAVPPRSDLLLALGVAALVLVEVVADDLTPYAASVPLGLAQAGALAWRRRAPLATVAVTTIALFAETAAGVSLHTPVSPIVIGLIAVYSVGQYEPLPRAALGLAVAMCGILGAVQVASANGESYRAFDRLFVTVFIVAPWLAGRALHRRAREAAALTEDAARREREQELAAEEERARIARELHDVIAHSLGVIVVQAGAGERVAGRDPAQAVEALRSIQQVGRQALSEMARLVGVLREGEEVGLEPQPGLGQLGALLDQTRQAGLAVALAVEGEERPLPPGLDLSAYRIVQEALTNARKHAGEGRVDVTLRYAGDGLEIEVADDGAGAPADVDGGGHGLTGMRERVAVFGGRLEAGPRAGGGFAVRATLPLEAVQA